ncbi:MAG TPA: CoA transferase [Ilumatobacteraceae bacterium]|nr:CoA transferase [Ilumatobacteraceae bacterium]
MDEGIGATPRAGDTADVVARWAASGCMFLTGPPDSPGLGPPAPLVPGLAALAERVERGAVAVGAVLRVDPLERLTERAGALGLSRRGRTSCGGATRLLRTADGWIALSLARPDDVDLVPAWLESDGDGVAWDAIARSVSSRRGSELVRRGVLVGLPIAMLPAAWGGERRPPAPPPFSGLACHPTPVDGAAARPRSVDDTVVVDLSSLWAGPLCGALLAECGFRVVKVESTRRPDGARGGSPAFFDRMNARKRSVALDLQTPAGTRALRRLLDHADVVIEASRPRALAQLGIDPLRLVAHGPRVWVSITGHGYRGESGLRTGFGDDAAVAGGLVVWEGQDPYFCCDAVADPISGLTAAAATLTALVAGGRWHLDVAMSSVAAGMAGPTLPVPAGTSVAAPRAPVASNPAPGLGADTRPVLDEIGHR